MTFNVQPETDGWPA